MKLSRLEQETIILYNQAESSADVYTHDPALLSKLKTLAEKHPKQVKCNDSNSFTVPKRCVTVREPYSEARRAAASQRAKEAGITPPSRGKRSIIE